MTLTMGSLFDGIGGFPLAFERHGFECKWSVEIDKDCNRVLSRHWPDVPKYLDVCEVGAHNLTPVDVITFGSPYQDLSVAGKRGGLDGARSSLFYEAIRICDELKPTLALWENVPGAFSNNAGRDFAGVLLAFRELGARDICWRTLDAQHFGVPQRRRRIFLVADFGGERVGEILLESKSVCRNPQTSRETGARLATDVAAGLRHGGGNGRGYNLDAESGLVAAPLTAGSATGKGVNKPGRRQEDDVNIVAALTSNGVGTCGADDNQAQGGHLLAPALTAHTPRYNGGDEQLVVRPVVDVFQQSSLAGRGTFGYESDAESAKSVKTQGDGQMIVQGFTNRAEVMDDEAHETLRSASHGALPMVAQCVTGDTAHALSAEGADASEDGTGRGTPIVIQDASMPRAKKQNGIGISEGGPMYTLDGHGAHGVLPFDSTQVTSDKNYSAPREGDPCHPLAGRAHPPAVAFTERTRANGRTFESQEEMAYALTNPGSGGRTHSRQLHDGYGVRRLTPTECERLQGFPDGWTSKGADRKPIADSARYRMLGNSVAVPVVAWIAQRMAVALNAEGRR